MNKIYTTLALGLMMIASTYAQIDRSQAPKPGPAPEINIPEPGVFELDNGLQVIVSSDHRLPKVSFNLVFTSDPALEGKKAGLSDMVGELILSGTKNRSKDELDREKDFIGATLSAGSSSIFLSMLTKHMDKGLELMLDVLHNANFPASEFDRVKKQYESNLLSVKTNPNAMASNAEAKVVFPNHPYGEVMTEATLANIEREDIVEFYKKRFIPAGSYLVIVGDITLENAKEIAHAQFGNWDGGVPFEADYHKGQIAKNNRVIFVEKPGAVQSVINIAFPMDITPGHEDVIKLSVMNKLFGGGGFGTRLMQNLREDKAWTYGAYSSTNINREGSWFSASGSFRNEVTDSAIYEFISEFERIVEEFVTDEELELNKASMAGSFARSLESSRTIANFALSTFRNNLPADYYQTYLKKLAAVSKEDIIEVAKKYITPKNLNIIVVGNEDVLDKIARFDADGEIERLDAFGNPASKKEYRESTLSGKEILTNYILAVTQSKNMKKANKVISKVKTMEQKTTVTPQQSPMALTMKNYYMAPNKRAMTLTVMGMEVQKEVFDGTAGGTKTMNQSMGHDVTEFTQEELALKSKTSGLFEELAMLDGSISFEVLGIDVVNGKDFYVIQYESEDATTRLFYSVEDFLKKHSEGLQITEEGPINTNATFSDYRAVKGILFPHQTVQMFESVVMDGKVDSIVINGKIDDSVFKL
jgi:predicted Zn-dependent peptidase